MTDLTDKWKKGELELDKNYYIKLEDGTIEIQMYVGGFLCNENNQVDEVLAPVPSYEEYLSLTYAKEEDEGLIAEYEAENAKLKKLLKECKDVAEFTKTIVNKHKWLDGVIAKINKALGEDK